MTSLDQHPVSVGDIEGELARIWEEIECPDKVKAALFNLIVHIHDREHVGYVEQVMGKILGKFPCRVMYVIENPDAKEDYTHTQVAVNEISEGISCDQIQVEFAGKDREKVPFILLPHLLADLPVYLFWVGDPIGHNGLYDMLKPRIDRIIFDPDTLDHLSEFCDHALGLPGVIADLNWAMCDGWREVIRYAFNRPEYIKVLRECEQLKMSYYTGKSPFRRDGNLPAVYLYGWLAAQTGWTQLPQVEMVAIEDESQPFGAIASLEIIAGDNHFSFVGQDRSVIVNRSDKEKCDLPYAHHVVRSERERALVRELFKSSQSAHYRNTLQFLASKPWRSP